MLYYVQIRNMGIMKVLVDVVRNLYFSHKLKNRELNSSEREFTILKHFILKGDTVVDVGANIGRYTKEFAALVSNEGSVFCFEPNLRIIRINMKLMNACKYKNIVYVPYGLLDYTGSATFLQDWTKPKKAKFSTATRSRFLESEQMEQAVKSLVFELDNFKLNPSFIKIDVEGSELKVLKGAVDTIRRSRPNLLIEDNDERIDKFLADLNYKSFKIADSRNKIYIHKNDKKSVLKIEYLIKILH